MEFNAIKAMLRGKGLEEGTQEFEDALAPYKEATVSDGQAWRTLDSYRDLMIMAGRWNN